MDKSLVYNWEVELAYLYTEIDKFLNKRDTLDMEFSEILDRLTHLKRDTGLNNHRNIYDEFVYNDVIRLKEIVDRIEYYDMLIDDYRKHIDRNIRLMKKD